MKKIISILIAVATISLVFLSVQGDTTETSAPSDSLIMTTSPFGSDVEIPAPSGGNIVVSEPAGAEPVSDPLLTGSPDATMLDRVLSWVSTPENKAALKKQYTDKGFAEFPAVINAMLEIPDDNISAPSSSNTGSGTTGGNSKIMVTLTKPLERDRIQYLTSEMFLVCGKAADSSINIIIAAYNSEKGIYEKLIFAGDNGSVRLFFNLFAEELQLGKGRNRFKIIAYTEDAIDEPDAGVNMQVLYFDIYLINKSLLNPERKTSDYFEIPSSETGSLLWDIRKVFPKVTEAS